MYKYCGVLLAVLLSACTAASPTSPEANARATTAVNMPASLALTPHLAVDPASPVVGATATLSASVDEAIEPLTYLWTFGDGYSTSTTSNRVDHVYAGTGLITSSVRVTDATARTGSASTLVTVQEQPVAKNPGDPIPAPKPAPPPAVFALSIDCGGGNGAVARFFCQVTPTLDGQAVASDLIRVCDYYWTDNFGEKFGGHAAPKCAAVFEGMGNGPWGVRVEVELTTGHSGRISKQLVRP